MNLLVTMRYLRYRRGTYELAKPTRRWMLEDGDGGIRDLILMKRLEWRWIEGLEAYLRTGVPADVHGAMSPDDWQTYQRGMRAQAGVGAPNLARLLPIPKGAREMLDIGGSHGYWSVRCWSGVASRSLPGMSAAGISSSSRRAPPARSSSTSATA